MVLPSQVNTVVKSNSIPCLLSAVWTSVEFLHCDLIKRRSVDGNSSQLLGLITVDFSLF